MLRSIIGAGLTLLVLTSDAPAQSALRAALRPGLSDVSAQRGLDKGLLVPYGYKTDEQLGRTRGGGLPTKKINPTNRKQPVSAGSAVPSRSRQSARPNFNYACKTKYPTFVSWMERQWTRCRRSPTPGYGEEQLKAWQCWCRKA